MVAEDALRPTRSHVDVVGPKCCRCAAHHHHCEGDMGVLEWSGDWCFEREG